MKSKQEDIIVESIVISELFKGRTFKNFSSLRKYAYRLINKQRDKWLHLVLAKNNILINEITMTRREIVEIFEENKVRILDEDKVYTVYKDNVLIGEWSNSRAIHMNADGKMEIKIQYVIG